MVFIFIMYAYVNYEMCSGRLQKLGYHPRIQKLVALIEQVAAVASLVNTICRSSLSLTDTIKKDPKMQLPTYPSISNHLQYSSTSFISSVSISHAI